MKKKIISGGSYNLVDVTVFPYDDVVRAAFSFEVAQLCLSWDSTFHSPTPS